MCSPIVLLSWECFGWHTTHRLHLSLTNSPVLYRYHAGSLCMPHTPDTAYQQSRVFLCTHSHLQHADWGLSDKNIPSHDPSLTTDSAWEYAGDDEFTDLATALALSLQAPNGPVSSLCMGCGHNHISNSNRDFPIAFPKLHPFSCLWPQGSKSLFSGGDRFFDDGKQSSCLSNSFLHW